MFQMFLIWFNLVKPPIRFAKKLTFFELAVACFLESDSKTARLFPANNVYQKHYN